MTIKHCTCDHSVQDELHGNKMRAMNKTTNGGYRCTVCGKSHDGGYRR